MRPCLLRGGSNPASQGLVCLSPLSKCALCPVSGPTPTTTTSISLVAHGTSPACPAGALLPSSPWGSPSQQPWLPGSERLLGQVLSPGKRGCDRSLHRQFWCLKMPFPGMPPVTMPCFTSRKFLQYLVSLLPSSYHRYKCTFSFCLILLM